MSEEDGADDVTVNEDSGEKDKEYFLGFCWVWKAVFMHRLESDFEILKEEED